MMSDTKYKEHTSIPSKVIANSIFKKPRNVNLPQNFDADFLKRDWELVRPPNLAESFGYMS